MKGSQSSRQQELDQHKKDVIKWEKQAAIRRKKLLLQRHDWQSNIQDWENKTDAKQAEVGKELSLGPNKEVQKQLNSVSRLLHKKSYTKTDEAKALATLDDAFPVTETTGETEDKQVSEISHLKYIPQHASGEPGWINRHKYQARSSSAEKQDVKDISPNWVRWVFEEHFCYVVIKQGIFDFEKYDGVVQNMRWVPVPLGDARKDDAGAPVELMVTSVPLKYKQFEEETCAYKGLASALHYCATKLNMGDKQVASNLASVAVAQASQDARTQLENLTKLVKEKSTYWRKHELRAKQKTVKEWDILNIRSPFPTVVVLLGTDGGQSHSVTLVNDLVFDFNCTHAMRLSKETLDWCCNCPDGFLRAVYLLRFWH